MRKILTVDDSRAVRMIVTKNVKEMGFEVDEAEDGEQGLARLEEVVYDLVILDVTMPNLDGPGMLARMREAGNQTPVLMLTSESKRSIVATLMKLGISDYILKPFRPEELKAKVAKALNQAGPAASPGEDPAIVQQPPRAAAAVDVSGPGETSGKQFVDVLVIDDMENVPKRLRALIPEHLTLQSAPSGAAALTMCRSRVFRVVLVDHELPDVNTAALVAQCRLLQPQAVFLAMCLRTTNNVRDELRTAGFDGVLFKPFDAVAMEEFLLRHFDNQNAIQKEDNVIRVGAFRGREPRLPGYFLQVGNAIGAAVQEIASACYAEAIVDVSAMPLAPDKLARLVIDVEAACKRVGLELRLVAPAALGGPLRQIEETRNVAVFASVVDALGKAA